MSVMEASLAALIRHHCPQDAERIVRLREDYRDARHGYIRGGARPAHSSAELFDAFSKASVTYFDALRDLALKVILERKLRRHTTFSTLALGELL